MTDQPAPAYLDPVRDELDRLRTENAELRAQLGGSGCLSTDCPEQSVWPYLCETHLTEALAEEERRIDEADKRTDEAEARVDQLTDTLTLRSDALNRTGASNDTLRATLARIAVRIERGIERDDEGYRGAAAEALYDIREELALADQEPARD